MAPLALMMVLVGALRGAGDTRWPLALNLFGIVFFRVPLALYLAHSTIHLPLIDYTIHGAGLGVVGAWYAAVIDIVVRCVLLCSASATMPGSESMCNRNALRECQADVMSHALTGSRHRFRSV